jgi:hypothetical protein
VWDRVKTGGRRSESEGKVIVWKHEGKLSSNRYQIRWEHNIKMDLIQRGWGVKDKFIYLSVCVCVWTSDRLFLCEEKSFFCSWTTEIFSNFWP